jgi:hypothetical protein
VLAVPRSRARNQLEVENASLRGQNEPVVEGAAELHEQFMVRYRYWYQSGHSQTSRRDEVRLSWAQIFVAIGPAFIRPRSSDIIGPVLMKYVHENIIQRNEMSLYVSDANTIKMHFTALRLIQSEVGTAAQGGGLTEFISLTPAGHHKLLELMAVRSTSPATDVGLDRSTTASASGWCAGD